MYLYSRGFDNVFFQLYGYHRDLNFLTHSCPTRRTSVLVVRRYVVLEPATLRRRLADFRSQVCHGSRTCVTASSFRRLSFAGSSGVSNLRRSVVVSATVVRRFGGVLGSPARTIRTTVARTPPLGRGGTGERPCRRGPGDR